MNTKRLQKSLNRAVDQQMAVLIHNTCERIVTEPTKAVDELRAGIHNLIDVEDHAINILMLK